MLKIFCICLIRFFHKIGDICKKCFFKAINLNLPCLLDVFDGLVNGKYESDFPSREFNKFNKKTVIMEVYFTY